MHLLSIERDDLLKIHDMFKALDTSTRQRQLPVKVCALYFFHWLTVIHDIVARIESKYVIKQYMSWCTIISFSLRWQKCTRTEAFVHYHRGWTPFYLKFDPKCSTTFPWCMINVPAVFAWCRINAPVAFVHKVEFSYIGWNGVHPLRLLSRRVRTT